MNRLLGRNKKYAEITIPAGVQPCADSFNLEVVPYNRKMNRELAQVLTELTWHQIKTELQDALNGEETLAARKAFAMRTRFFFYGMIPLMAGFAGGFLMSFLGGTDENIPLLATGVVFIVIFVVSFGFFFYNGTKFTESVQALKRTGLQAVNGGVLDRLREQHPLLRFELLNLDKPGQVCTLRVSLLEMPVAAVVETSTKEPVATKYTV